jgi:hypothetical protein
MATETAIGVLFSGATALAGLILVFLGGIVNAYETYDTAEKKAVRKKFRKRAWLSFVGFLFAIFSALSALSLVYFDSLLLEQFSFVTVLVSFGFVIALALLAVKEI